MALKVQVLNQCSGLGGAIFVFGTPKALSKVYNYEINSLFFYLNLHANNEHGINWSLNSERCFRILRYHLAQFVYAKSLRVKVTLRSIIKFRT